MTVVVTFTLLNTFIIIALNLALTNADTVIRYSSVFEQGVSLKASQGLATGL